MDKAIERLIGIKVIQITDHNGSGGVNSFVYDLCVAQSAAGMDVTFISIIDLKEKAALAELQELRNKNVHVITLQASSKPDALLHWIYELRKQIQTVAEREQCICNLHLKLSVLMGVIATVGIKNVVRVETYHNSYHHYELQYLMCSPFIKHYFAISKTCGEEMRRRFRTPDTKLSVIPNGIDRRTVRVLGKAHRNSATDSCLKLLSVGRMSYEKNFTRPVLALKNICNASLQYSLIGDGPQMGEVRAAASNNPYIQFDGWLPRNEVLGRICNADVVIMPSLWEGRSILQLEAMAMDIPMILSDVPALREVFDEKPLTRDEMFRKCRWGYLVRTNEVDSYRLAVLEFQSLAKEEILNMKAYIRKISEENDMKVTVSAYNSLYMKLLR